jgi:hypothetical protein
VGSVLSYFLIRGHPGVHMGSNAVNKRPCAKLTLAYKFFPIFKKKSLKLKACFQKKFGIPKSKSRNLALDFQNFLKDATFTIFPFHHIKCLKSNFKISTPKSTRIKEF